MVNGILTLFRTPLVDLSRPSVNGHIQVNLSPDRWLWLSGGAMPARAVRRVMAVAIAPVSAQGKVRLTPLRRADCLLPAVVSWLFAIGVCRRHERMASEGFFNTMQAVIELSTFGVAPSRGNVIQP